MITKIRVSIIGVMAFWNLALTVLFVCGMALHHTNAVVNDVSTQVPSLVSFQGFLCDKDNVPIEGNRIISFQIWDSDKNGNCIWPEKSNPNEWEFHSTSVSNGIFSIQLGKNYPINFSSLSEANSYWLQIMTGDDVMSNRIQLVSSLFSVNSQKSTDSVNSRYSIDSDGSEHAEHSDISEKLNLLNLFRQTTELVGLRGISPIHNTIPCESSGNSYSVNFNNVPGNPSGKKFIAILDVQASLSNWNSSAPIKIMIRNSDGILRELYFSGPLPGVKQAYSKTVLMPITANDNRIFITKDVSDCDDYFTWLVINCDGIIPVE